MSREQKVKIVFFATLFFIMIFAIPIYIFVPVYIDHWGVEEDFDSGHHYGFMIGESVKANFEILETSYSSGFYIEPRSYNPLVPLGVVPLIPEAQKELFVFSQEWKFFGSKNGAVNFSDSYHLWFEAGTLVRIRRICCPTTELP